MTRVDLFYGGLIAINAVTIATFWGPNCLLNMACIIFLVLAWLRAKQLE